MFNKKVVVKIGGMSCEHCAKAVHDGLMNVDGVKSVKVSLKDNKATISHKKVININDIKKIIEDLDYKFIGVE